MEEDWGIIGHRRIVDFLQASLAKGRLAHAYLFCGLPSLGKTTVAERFAGQLLGQKGLQSGEFYKLEPLSEKQEITIEQVREWRRSLTFKNLGGQYKVGLIYEAEKLNRESGNALLKTLEEPLGQTVLILITSSWERLLPTLVSRSQLIKFLPVNSRDLTSVLQHQVPSAKKLKQIISLAQGRPGLAKKLAVNEDFFNSYLKYRQLAEAALSELPTARWKLLDQLIEPLKDLKQKVNAALDFLNHLESVLRSQLLSQFGSADSRLAAADGSLFSPPQLVRALGKINEARQFLAANVQPRLVLENILLNL